MILQEDLTSIGSFFKPHGIKGELTAELDYDLSPEDLRCIVLDIDSIYVPFFIESFRPKGNSSWLIKLDGVDDEKQANDFVNKEIFGVTAELDLDEEEGEGIHLYDLIGYTLTSDGQTVGAISDIDDSTANVLLSVTLPDGSTIYVPFADELIVELQPETKTIEMNLPTGIIDLNN